MPDHPVILIEISGLRGVGKSVLAAHFRDLLFQLEIAFAGPDGLPERTPDALAGAIVNLRTRGLSVKFVETCTGLPPQIDARRGQTRIIRETLKRMKCVHG